MLDTIFLVSAIVGGAPLVLRAALMLFGVGDDAALNDAAGAHAEGDTATRLLSTVWDSGGANGRASSTASFLASLVTSLPPLQEIAKMAGVELPEYLGRMSDAKAEERPGGPRG